MFCNLIEIAVMTYQHAINCIENHFTVKEIISRLLPRCYTVCIQQYPQYIQQIF